MIDMKNIYKIGLAFSFSFVSIFISAQATTTPGVDTNFRLALPLIGGTDVSMQSTSGLGTFLFKGEDGRTKTFMSRGTISKDDLLDDIGSAFQNHTSVATTLLGLSRHLSESRSQAFGLNLRMEENLRIARGAFDMLKDVENKDYDLSRSGLSASLYAELYYHENRKLTDQLTVGATAKLLVGLANMNLDIDDLNVNLDQSQWSAQGHLALNTSGMDFTTTTKDYAQAGRGQYTMVDGLKYGGIGFNGLGAAIDLEATYQLTPQWSLTAAVRDLGFITWLNNHQALNHGTPFLFDGIRDAGVKDPEEDYGDRVVGESASTQIDRLGDDLMDLFRLEETGQHSFTDFLGATLHLGTRYHFTRQWTAGLDLTSQLRGRYSWYEARLLASYSPTQSLTFTLQPALSTFGFSVGARADYCTRSGWSFFLASSHIPTQFTPQLLPTSLNGSLWFGVNMPL